MQNLLKTTKELNISLPKSYLQTMEKFELFMLIEFKDKELDLINKNLLTEQPKNDLPKWQYLTKWVASNQFKQSAIGLVDRHDIKGAIDSRRVANDFMFGSYGDGVRLYFDVQDDFSVWEYWLDDGSIGKIADSFDEILANGEVIECE